MKNKTPILNLLEQKRKKRLEKVFFSDEWSEKQREIKKFKKGELTKESLKVILFDIGSLKDNFISNEKEQFERHLKLLKGNIKDIWGVK